MGDKIKINYIWTTLSSFLANQPSLADNFGLLKTCMLTPPPQQRKDQEWKDQF